MDISRDTERTLSIIAINALNIEGHIRYIREFNNIASDDLLLDSLQKALVLSRVNAETLESIYKQYQK